MQVLGQQRGILCEEKEELNKGERFALILSVCTCVVDHVIMLERERERRERKGVEISLEKWNNKGERN